MDDPDAVRVEEERGRGAADPAPHGGRPDDIGKVIGRGGRTARAIRTVVRAAAIRSGTHVMVEIVG